MTDNTHSLLAPYLTHRARNQWAEESIMRTKLRRDTYAREAWANIACLTLLAVATIVSLFVGFNGLHIP